MILKLKLAGNFNFEEDMMDSIEGRNNSSLTLCNSALD